MNTRLVAPIRWLMAVVVIFGLLGFAAAPVRPAQAATSVSPATALVPTAGISAVDSCGYPYSSSNPLTNVVFNESEVLRGFSPVDAGVAQSGDTIKVWYNDEHALTLGVRQVKVKTSSGTTTTDYPIAALTTNPGSAFDPQLGSTALSGDQAGTDISDRPMWPAIFITDVTADPNNQAGDWQFGGAALGPHAVFGTWKGAVRLVDKTHSPAVVSVTPDADPAKNNWNLDGGDPPPAGLTNEGYGAEVRWDVDRLVSAGQLIPGHTYRFQFMVHDGDQNKTGGDVGEACTTISIQKPPADLQVRKTLTTPAPVYSGQEISFTIRLTNTGQSTLSFIPLRDWYDPTILDFVGATPQPDSVAGGTLTWNDLTATLGALPPGQATAVVVRFLALKATTSTAVAAAGLGAGPVAQPAKLPQSPAVNAQSPTCTPTVDSCGYPYSSSNALTSVVFNESEVLRGFSPVNGGVARPGDTLKVWYNDEHALTLGVRQVQVKTSSGTTTTNYSLTPLATNPGSAYDPQTGSNLLSGDQAGTDISNRPMWPAIFISDITANPNNRAGDWQLGGAALAPHAVFGTWKAAVRLVDKTYSPAAVTVTPDADPAKNNWNLDGGDPAPAGLINEGYGAEVRWNVDRLVAAGLLISGHTYRFQFMVHDGDQNKTGGDVGEACTTITVAPTGSIGDRVWYDLNGDKTQQPAEPGLNGVKVDLYGGVCPAIGKPSGTPLKSLVTAVDGNYDFANVMAGSYCVAVDASTVPAGFALTTANDPLTVVLANNQDYNAADFGYRAQCPNGTPNLATVSGAEDQFDTIVADRRDFACVPIQNGGRIGDLVWNDANGNGVQDLYDSNGDGTPDTPEPGLEGAVVALTLPGSMALTLPGGSVITQTTTITGYYQFIGLGPGQYAVDVIQVPAGYFATTNNHPQTVNLAAGQAFENADFGYAGKASLSGIVFYDWNSDGDQGVGEDGIPDVPVCLYRDDDRDGALDDPGDTWLPPCQNTTIGSPTSDPGGYSFTGLLPGWYLIVETQPAGLQNSTPEDNVIPRTLVFVGPGPLSTDNNYGEILYVKLGDFVYLDFNANGQQDPGENTGLTGVPLHVTGKNVLMELVDTTINTVNGSYLDQGLLPGTYTVTAPSTFSGFHLTSPSVQTTTLGIAKTADLGLDFGYVYPTGVGVQQFGALAGRSRIELSWLASGEPAPAFNVWRAENGKGVDAVQVNAEALAGTTGAYRFTDASVTVGQTYWYWLEETVSGQRFGPQSVTVRPMVIGAYLPLIGR
ncbi:MAG: hypothetical protein NT169_26320 [Chloroflexi bacterium]|nr:hypothetical protein [Chloroflexota bacterium]